MNSLRLAYEVATRLARLAAMATPDGSGKWRRSLRARRDIAERFNAFGRSARDESRPLLWMHAPSVGEGLQARPVLERIRGERPELQLAYTFFSPSAEAFARTLQVDFADYLPFDSTPDARTALAALRPRALVFSKLDVWPTLALEAHRHGARLGLISATIAAASRRRSRLAAPFLRDAYARLDAVGAIDAADAERLAGLGVRPDVISVTGDTRYDQVWARAQRLDRDGELLGQLRSSRPTLVAGSTWPSDERVLLEAWSGVRDRLPEARLIIAPHEPTAVHIEPIVRWARRERLTLCRAGAPGARAADVILVDRMGVLGDLYALAQAAFVGGGFHGAGLHSVLEPAAFGVPVAFGPRFSNSRDAALLLAARGAVSVSTATQLRDAMVRWLGTPAERDAVGGSARGLVERGLGAAARSTALVLRLLG